MDVHARHTPGQGAYLRQGGGSGDQSAWKLQQRKTLGLWIHSGTLDPFWDTAVLRRDIQRISMVGVWDWIIC